MPPPISVLVLSSDQLFADAIAVSLSRQPDLRTVAVSGEPVDIVLIDASSNAGEALDRLWKLREGLADAKPIVLGLEQEDETLLEFIEAGVRGYVLRSATPAGLAEVIRSVHLGETPCSPRIAASVVERIALLAREREVLDQLDLGPLTAREREILSLMAKGLRNKEIGRQLLITTQTVKNHVHNILEKLQVHRRREAVRLACERGLLADLDLF
ncbi:MAG TPA: response regulator transcription factor [Thermoanaerobaculia bacterium]|nr:response regulator transcription factor [Thermoanaerobaculia bacterium]